MYEFEFEGFSKEQCDAYLERMGAEFDGNCTLENLDMLISKHQKNVPFENLAMFMNWGTVDLTPDALYKKIVTERRGGFCFELNGGLLLLLKGLGYDVVGCMARIGLPFIGKLGGLFHMGIIARIDGKQYYCDAGMAGPKADWAVEFEKDSSNPIVSSRHGETYWIEDTDEGWKMVKSKGSPFDDGAVIIFAPIALLPQDFYAHCAELCATTYTIFSKMKLVNVCKENGYIDLKGNHLKIVDGDIVEERDFEDSEFPAILEKYFGIIYK